jgi:hypothetical protein
MYKKRSSVEFRCGGGEARNFNIAALAGRAIRVERKNLTKFRGKPVLQPSENKIDCDKSECREAITFPLEGCMPEVGVLPNKISLRDHDAPVYKLLANRASCSRARHPFLPRQAASIPERHAKGAKWRLFFPHCTGPAVRCSLSPAAKRLSFEAGGQPEITRNTSRTKSPIAMSLNNVAAGSLGQN